MASWVAQALAAAQDWVRGGREGAWVQALLELVEPGSYVLVVGAGSCGGLVRALPLLRARGVRAVAQEADGALAARGAAALAAAGGLGAVRVVHAALPGLRPPDGRLFDHVLSAGGFAALGVGGAGRAHAAQALAAAAALLVDQQDGRVLLAEPVAAARGSLAADVLAPAAAALGLASAPICEGDLDDALCDAGLVVVRYDRLRSPADPAGDGARLIVARSRRYVRGSVGPVL